MPSVDRTTKSNVDRGSVAQNANAGAAPRRSRFVTFCLALLCVAVPIFAGFVVLGYGGRFYPAGDSLAAFRVQFACLLLATALLGALLASRRGTARVALFLGAALLGIGALAEPMMSRVVASAAPKKPILRLYQKNVLFLSKTTQELADDILRTRSDVVTLQEVNINAVDLLERLAPQMPHQLVCQPGWLAVAVITHLPVKDELCDAANSIAALRVETPAGLVWVVTLHVRWPWPYGQAEQVAHLAPAIAALEGPVILAGDFNMTPWSYSVRTLQRASDTIRPRPIASTIYIAHFPLLGVPIDHVLVPSGWASTVARRPRFQSDHLGLLVTTGPR